MVETCPVHCTKVLSVPQPKAHDDSSLMYYRELKSYWMKILKYEKTKLGMQHVLFNLWLQDAVVYLQKMCL